MAVKVLRMSIALALCAAIVPVSAQAVIKNYELNIPRQSLETALREFANQTGLQVARFTDTVDGSAVVGPVAGKYSADEALKSLLSSSGLTYKVVNDRTIAVTKPSETASQSTGTPAESGGTEESESPTAASGSRWEGFRLAQADTSSRDEEESKDHSSRDSEKNVMELEEIVVTGSHIRGVAPAGSALLSFSGEDIARSGAGSIDQFFEQLPQNFSGGASQRNGRSRNSDARINSGNGAAINLRGLGSGTTLVLVNGHRVAPTANGAFVDVSMIPVGAIERVDILADGASAIYGSDAVGGVVNLVLRRDYSGIGTGVRYGSDSGGDSDEWRATQNAGTNWGSGGALFSYEFYSRGDLRARDRDFATGVVPQTQTLLPAQKRHSALISGNQAIGSRLRLTGDVLYSKRDSGTTGFDPFLVGGSSKAKSEQTSASLAADYDLTEKWALQFSGSTSKATVDAVGQRLNASGQLLYVPSRRDNNKTSYLDATVTGTLLSLPGGDLRAAIGLNYLDERSSSRLGTSSPISGDRTNTAVFAELSVPIVGEKNRIPGIHGLELTVAGRHDHYSDFGSSNIPKFGLNYRPIESLNFRGTYSKSYRAPLLQDMVEHTFLILFDFPDPASSTGSTLALFSAGDGNTGLKPERARTWTAGFDLRPAELPVSLSLTYYNIEFRDRISVPAFSLFDYFTNPQVYSSVINRSPTLDLISGQIADADEFLNLHGPYADSDVQAFVDARISNIAVQKQSGIDALVASRFETPLGLLDLELSGTYITEFDRALTPTAQRLSVLNRLESPLDLRVRGQAGLSRGNLGFAVALNYAPQYENDLETPAKSIDSWTTVDIQLRYDIGDTALQSPFANMTVLFNIENLFDKAPPRTTGTIDNLGYDPANGDPMGRFVALELTKKW